MTQSHQKKKNKYYTHINLNIPPIKQFYLLRIHITWLIAMFDNTK